MSKLRSGGKPVRRTARTARAAVAILALSMAGCASKNQQSDYSSNVRGPQVSEQAAPASRVEIEDDGLPVQSPPVTPPRAIPDDPREPFSPNYGGPANPPAKRAPTAQQRTAVKPALPTDLPESTRPRLRVALTE